MTAFQSAPARATASHTLNSPDLRAAAILVLRDFYSFDRALSDAGVLQASRLHYAVSRRPPQSIGTLLAMIDMHDAEQSS